jgi:TM2 domain-containing membrane protein YozV
MSMSMSMVYCRGCGKQIHSTAITCPSCGAPQAIIVNAPNPRRKDKYAAALLAFFLGTFGAHKFYLDRFGTGLIYLIFFWTAIPTMISFVECIIFLVMSEYTFDEKYNDNYYD